MSIVANNYLDQLDDKHNHNCGTDYDHHYIDHHYIDQHYIDQHIIDHDDNHNRAALHRLMHMAMARRITEMDQGLWR
jgi:heterodisulfide reductase subunit B